MNILSNIRANKDKIGMKEAFEKIKKLYEYYIKKEYLKKWKEIINLNKILENIKINKRKEMEDNKNILLNTLLKWKAKKDKNQILDSLILNKVKSNKLSGMMKILDELREKIDNDSKKEAFNLIKNLYDAIKTKKPQIKKLKIKLVKKEANDANNNNQDENNNQNNEKKFKKRISYRNRIKKIKKNKGKKKDKLKDKLAQLKKVLLLLIIRIYKNQNDKLIKKYFDYYFHLGYYY